MAGIGLNRSIHAAAAIEVGSLELAFAIAGEHVGAMCLRAGPLLRQRETRVRLSYGTTQVDDRRNLSTHQGASELALDVAAWKLMPAVASAGYAFQNSFLPRKLGRPESTSILAPAAMIIESASRTISAARAIDLPRFWGGAIIILGLFARHQRSKGCDRRCRQRPAIRAAALNVNCSRLELPCWQVPFSRCRHWNARHGGANR
jgi:hypothetical protein